MTIFGDIFASCIFSEPRAARFRPASEIRTKATPCVAVWQTSNLRRLRLGDEKRRKKKNKEEDKPVCFTARLRSQVRMPPVRNARRTSPVYCKKLDSIRTKLTEEIHFEVCPYLHSASMDATPPSNAMRPPQAARARYKHQS